jgi:hypothetical protein
LLQVRLNAKDQSIAQIIAAAKIRFDRKTGQDQIENYGN